MLKHVIEKDEYIKNSYNIIFTPLKIQPKNVPVDKQCDVSLNITDKQINKIPNLITSSISNIHHCKKPIIDPYNKKFLNVFIDKSVFSNETCEWLITESYRRVKEVYGEWKNDRPVNYPAYDVSIDILEIPVINYILNSFAMKIGPLIYDNFNISNKEYNIVLQDAFFVKYEMDKQRSLVLHEDDTHLTAIILLSSKNSFTGGGTEFETGLSIHPSQGDMILFGSKFKHQGLEITSGVRMILTFFIDIEPI